MDTLPGLPKIMDTFLPIPLPPQGVVVPWYVPWDRTPVQAKTSGSKDTTPAPPWPNSAGDSGSAGRDWPPGGTQWGYQWGGGTGLIIGGLPSGGFDFTHPIRPPMPSEGFGDIGGDTSPGPKGGSDFIGMDGLIIGDWDDIPSPFKADWSLRDDPPLVLGEGPIDPGPDPLKADDLRIVKWFGPPDFNGELPWGGGGDDAGRHEWHIEGGGMGAKTSTGYPSGKKGDDDGDLFSEYDVGGFGLGGEENIINYDGSPVRDVRPVPPISGGMFHVGGTGSGPIDGNKGETGEGISCGGTNDG